MHQRRRPGAVLSQYSDDGSDIESSGGKHMKYSRMYAQGLDPLESIGAVGSADFSSIALYLPAIQVIFSVFLCCMVAMLACWLLPSTAISSVRTAALIVVCALITVRSPVRLSVSCRGVDAIFDTVRPAVFVYIFALISEQLSHACTPSGISSTSHIRWWIYYMCTFGMYMAGMLRALRPRAESDIPFAIAFGSIIVAALIPPVGDSASGPLCEPATFMAAIERVFRAVLFACTYCTMVYVSEPAHHSVSDVFVSSTRAAASSVWTLAINGYLLALAPIQIAVALWSRLSGGDGCTALRAYVSNATPVTRFSHLPTDPADDDQDHDHDPADSMSATSEPEGLHPSLHNAHRIQSSHAEHGAPVSSSIPATASRFELSLNGRSRLGVATRCEDAQPPSSCCGLGNQSAEPSASQTVPLKPIVANAKSQFALRCAHNGSSTAASTNERFAAAAAAAALADEIGSTL